MEIADDAFSATPMASVAEWLTGEGRYLDGGTIISEVAETPPSPEV
ncbi:hypothetical protein [Sphingomonas sp.]|nr:hypothetical protein [Sphingomonas sp.]